MTSRALVTLIGVALVSLLLIDTASVWARAGGGGSRGSRSYSRPASPASPAMPSIPSRSVTQPSQPRPSFFGGGLMGGIAGLALGGLLGSMLFGGMGGGFGGGLGLLELLLIGGATFFVVRRLRGRQATEPAPAYAGAGGASAYGARSESWSGGGGGATVEAPAGPSDLERGLGHIRQMDPSFDPVAFADWAKTVFANVQSGITRRDMSGTSDQLTPQEYARLQAQCDQLRGARRTNRIERIQIARAEVSEAWQERGQDWVTVYLAASLVDYTVDDATGAVVEGSKTIQDIEEYWTFTRPVGPKPWRLSAIQTS
jgi:predicted lipid-binding transport protein (Tim44 family)